MKINEKNTLELYKLFRHETLESYKLHRIAFEHYLTFVVAILGVSIAGFIQFDINGPSKILLCAPALNILICTFAIGMCNRAYQGALERITIILKLEEILNVNYIKNVAVTNKGCIKSFIDNKNLLPERWIESAKEYSSAKEFVKRKMKSGVNLYVRITFMIIILLNIILIISIFVMK